MPRKQRPPFEAAVIASPLFELASEIRIMIYELLLVQEGAMFLTSDIFARRDYGRQDSTSYLCELCGYTSLSSYGCQHHINKHHSRGGLSFRQQLGPPLPIVSVSLLQTCRIIRLEASPILYTKNAFHFSDPTTATNFRWCADCAQIVAVQDIGIYLHSLLFTQFSLWSTYLTKSTFSLGQDFPRLRRLTFNLNMRFGEMGSRLLRLMSEMYRMRSPGLDWVRVVSLTDEMVLDCFEPLVDRKDSSKDEKNEVRRHVWANEKGVLRKDAVLWWGSQDGAVPHVCRLFGD